MTRDTKQPTAHDQRSWVSWPDEIDGPLEIEVRWRMIDGRWECVGLAVGFAPGATLRPLLATDLRGIAMGPLLERAGRALALDLQETRDPHDAGPYGQHVASLIEAAPVPSGSRPLAEAAAVYRAAYARGERPTKAVAERWGLKPGTAAKWVSDCRAQGLLGPTRQGRAGGVLPPGGKESE